MQQLQLDINQILYSPFFHFALHPPPMWLEAAVRIIEAALSFFLNQSWVYSGVALIPFQAYSRSGVDPICSTPRSRVVE